MQSRIVAHGKLCAFKIRPAGRFVLSRIRIGLPHQNIHRIHLRGIVQIQRLFPAFFHGYRINVPVQRIPRRSLVFSDIILACGKLFSDGFSRLVCRKCTDHIRTFLIRINPVLGAVQTVASVPVCQIRLRRRLADLQRPFRAPFIGQIHKRLPVPLIHRGLGFNIFRILLCPVQALGKQILPVAFQTVTGTALFTQPVLVTAVRPPLFLQIQNIPDDFLPEQIFIRAVRSPAHMLIIPVHQRADQLNRLFGHMLLCRDPGLISFPEPDMRLRAVEPLSRLPAQYPLIPCIDYIRPALSIVYNADLRYTFLQFLCINLLTFISLCRHRHKRSQ